MPARAHPVALVTGGANGIGRAIVRHLTGNGWRVGVLDLPGSGLHRAFPRGTRHVTLIEGDVGIEETAPRAVAAILDRFGRGIVALTHALAVSLGPDIRVNCVSPGWIETKDQGALRRKDRAQHPAGRVGKPQDIVEIVFWLLDRERSSFVTGANFVVDGGMTRKMIYVE
jgi:NAD(P)-dependent dehydrogenase (short-subunit alcohol dehydrogenase family)